MITELKTSNEAIAFIGISCHVAKLLPMDLHTLFRILLLFALSHAVALGEEYEDPFDAAAKQAEKIGGQTHQFIEPGLIRKLTAKVKPAVVTVRQMGRDGNNRGIGAGFVIDKSGLIATNLHVIGESRPVEVEFDDGKVFPVVEIHSSDRRFDLAVLRIDPGERKLTALEIGDSEKLEQGQFIVGFGAPLGLKFSVVSGVVSAIRNLDADFLGEETPDFPMIQISMPIEQGNSGGPIVDFEGRVMGIVTLRHRMKDNLGFAVKSNDLSTILKKPNPVPMARWKTIGTLDPRQWSIVMKGDWNQKSGVIYAKTQGSGFGGRTLCLSEEELPEGPFEAAVKVKLEDESGAAGLAFSSDGGDIHYGFYPSNGKMRLTRFDGPSVYTWKILVDKEVESYNPGKWNQLKVRVEGETITGYVNGTEVLQVKDSGLPGRKAGLCKFRKTDARFREFRIGETIEFEQLTE
ncbi:MAG: S1C family serine protease [Verrucomicrobiales bacterium]|nr:S1C family serine protease [Verrucomicrobiales bacterium]